MLLRTVAVCCALGASALPTLRSTPGVAILSTWRGWGTSIAWWGNTAFGPRADIADAFWTLSPNVTLAGLRAPLPALGLTIGRYNAGGCGDATVNGSKVVYSPSIPPFKQVRGFWRDGLSADPTSPSWDWSADAMQVAAATAASARGAEIEVFSNSPMWWMLVNRNPSGSNDGSSDNLLPQYHGAHATYMSIVAAQLSRVHNWTLTSVEAFNEPGADWWKASGTQEGCHFSPATQAAVLPLLRPALTSAGAPPSVLVASSDESQFSQAIAGWKVLAAAGATRSIDVFNVHGYEPSGDRATLKQLVNGAGKRIRMSEHGEGDATGAQLATAVLLDVYTLNATSWVYWQLVRSFTVGGKVFFARPPPHPTPSPSWTGVGGARLHRTCPTACSRR